MARAKKKNRKTLKVLAIAALAVIVTALSAVYLYNTPLAVLQPAGPVAAGERHLLIVAFIMMLFVVIPVFVITFAIAWRYRESNHKAKYDPKLDHNHIAEGLWWLIPSALIAVLAVMTWHGTYKYDPHRPLASAEDTMKVQVVALDWRWLFIYPDERVASVNELHLPVNKAVEFQITADAPMNSFWIPQLGGQVYAMPGMGTSLHLMADRPGTYYGSSANISGKGFAGMHFNTIATSQKEFDTWVAGAATQKPLTKNLYDNLAKQNTDQSIYTYGRPATDLYDTIIAKYMHANHNTEEIE